MVIRSNNDYKIKVQDISKSFGNVQALKNISLTFEPDHIYGLLGRNGAGKTTLLNLISNRLYADSGTISVNGESVIDNDKALSKLYYMSEKNCYPESMTVDQAFKWAANFYPGFDRLRAKELCAKFELNGKKKIKQLSTGYNSIFKGIIALCVDADFILLDEPVLGLDANHRQLFYKSLMETYSDNPRTFIISTHLIEEITSMLETVMIIHRGEILNIDSTENLLKAGYSVSGKADTVERYISGKQIIGVDVLGGLKSAYVLGELDRAQVPPELDINRMDLQKLFIRMTENNQGGEAK